MNEIMMPEIIKGLHAGAVDAIEKARRTKTNLVIWRDGKIVEITPDEADAMLKEREVKNAQ